jgi:formamidopyrimidine-DNA glycosylase
MPELPEITVLARDLQREIVGVSFTGVEVLQPKILNMPEGDFRDAVIGASVVGVTSHGKWLKAETSQGWLLLNLGMGGEVLLTQRDSLPVKYRLVLDLDNDAVLAVNFWWFGHVHHAAALADHPMTARLGPHALDLTLDQFRSIVGSSRGGIKSLLLNQNRIAGIGNVYVQDPLFRAGVHPLRPASALSEAEITALWRALRETLQESIDLGGSHWELNLYGERGRWGKQHFLVAYREGQDCPTCGSTVVKIKTGSTSSHICPSCQPLEVRGQ